MNKALIIGASSDLGRALFRHLESVSSETLKGTYNSKPFPGGLKLDLATESDFGQLGFLDDKTTVVVLSAISDPSTVYQNKSFSRGINVLGIKRLLDFCRRRGSKVVFASSVEALDGSEAPQTEEVERRPLNEYGRMKAEIEEYLLETFSPGTFTIVRTPWICHLDFTSRCVVKNTYLQMLENDVPSFAADYLTGIVSAQDVCLAYERILALGDELPLVHISANGYFSRSELAELVLSKSARSQEMRFLQTTFKELKLDEPRANDTRLDNSLSVARLGMSYASASNVVVSKVEYLDTLSLNDA